MGSDSDRQRLHILAVPLPAQSHMSVLMQLCKRLAARPHVTISFVNIDSIHEQMVKHWNPPKGLDIRLESIPFEWKIPNGFDAYCARNNGLFVDMAEQQLVPELHELTTRLSKQVADRLGVPRVALWSGCASWACIEYHIPQLVAKNHIFFTDPEECWIDYIGGLPPIHSRDLPVYLQRSNDQLWKEHGIKRSKTIHRVSWVLVNSFYLLEQQAFDFMRDRLGEKVVPIGPLFLLNGGTDSEPENVILRTEDAKCISWLDAQKKNSVLYVSFGSIAVLTKQQCQQLAAALVSCDAAFLWVVRPEQVTGGLPDDDYSSFCDSVKNKGLLISWAPQLQVLKHPAVGGFLTHCGWNSMLESIVNGVPMLGWPWGAEQNTNCKLMADVWKIGAGLSASTGGKVIQQEEIVRGIKSVMEDESIRTRAEALKVACAEAVKQADRNAEALLDELATTDGVAFYSD